MSELKRSRIKFFCHNRRAGVSIMFAIVLPLLLATFSLGIDGSRFLIKRARLADALSQGSFAVASTNTNLTTSQEKTEGKELVRNYIDYYLPGDLIDESTLDVQAVLETDPDDSTVISKVDYIATAKIITHPIFDGLSNALPGFSKDVSISADSNNGIVRKVMGNVNVESDIAFAVDFSGSMLEKSGGKMRIDILREVVTDLATQIADERSKSKVALIPFDIGIPVKLEEKNEAGGDRIGCVSPYKFKQLYQIDHAFWANKMIDWSASGIGTSGVDRADVIKSYLDLKRYNYYSNDVRAALGGGNAYQRFCALNSSYNASAASGSVNSNPLSCEAIDEISAVAARNYQEIKNYSDIVQSYFYPLMKNTRSQSFANNETIDYSGTTNGSFLFDDDSMKPFERPFLSIDMGNPFKAMCKTGFNIAGIIPAWGPAESIPEGYPNYAGPNYYSENLKKIRQNAYVIGLTSDKSDIDKFNNMWPQNGAGTDITAGILYAAREVAKGDNPRKIIIIVTDGEEYGEQDTVGMTFRLNGMCRKVMDGIMNNSRNTKEVKMYFVSLTNSYLTPSILYGWKRYCVGDDGAFVATDYSALKEAITSIVSSTPGGLNFINKSESTAP